VSMKRVTLIECRSFPGKDPFVQAFYPDEESAFFESSVKKNSPNALWNESFYCSLGRSSTLRLACHDQRGGGNSVFVGNVFVDLTSDGLKTVELLNATLFVEVETTHKGANMLSVRMNAVRGCSESLLCRGVYASSIVGEFTISATVSPTFMFEPIGGHAAFEVSLWPVDGSSPVASGLVDLRVSGVQEIQCQDCITPISMLVEVVNPSVISRQSNATICVSRLVTNVPVAHWQLISEEVQSPWLLAQDYWCFETTLRSFRVDVFTDSGMRGVLWLDLDDAAESKAAVPIVSRGIIKDGLDGFIDWCWSAQPTWNLGQPTFTLTSEGHDATRREKQCSVSLKIFGCVAFSAGNLAITCGSAVTTIPFSSKQGFSVVNKTLHAIVSPPMHHILFSLSVTADGSVFFGQLSPFHLLDEGRQWVPLEKGGAVGGFVEVEWSSKFERRFTHDCEDLSQVSQIEIVEARSLWSADLGGTCNAFCVLQTLPLSDSCRLCSHVVKKSLNPRWNWETTVTLNASNGVVINVLDADSADDEFLGLLALPSSSFFWKCQSGDCWLPLADQPSSKILGNHCGALRLRWNHMKDGVTKSVGTFVDAISAGECEIFFENAEVVSDQATSLCVAGQPVQSTSSIRLAAAHVQSLAVLGSIPIEAVTKAGSMHRGSVMLTKLSVKRKQFAVALTNGLDEALVMSCEIQLVWRKKVAQKWNRNLDGTLPFNFVIRQLRLEEPIDGDAMLIIPDVEGPPTTVSLIEGLDGICAIKRSVKLSSNDDMVLVLVTTSQGTEIGHLDVHPLLDFDHRSGNQWFALLSETTVVGAVEIEYHHLLTATVPTTGHSELEHIVAVEVVQIRGLWPIGSGDQPALPRAQVGLRIGKHSFSSQRAPPSLSPIFQEGHTFSLSTEELNEDIRISVIDTSSLILIGQGVASLRELLQKPSSKQWISVIGDSNQFCEVLIAWSSDITAIGTSSHASDVCAVFVESAMGLFPRKLDGSPRTTCSIVAKCIIWGPARKIILAEKSTLAVPNSLNPSWEASLCTLQNDCTVQLLVFDRADHDAFLGSVVLLPSQIVGVSSSFSLLNCDIDGKPNAALQSLLESRDESERSLGSLRVSRSTCSSDNQQSTSWIIVDIFPKALRLNLSGDVRVATLQLSWGSPSKHLQFEVTGDSINPIISPSTQRLCVANPCVVKAVVCDSSHKELGHASMVISHDEHSSSSLDDEMWTTFQTAESRDPVATLYSLFRVVSTAADDNIVERTTTLHLRGISGLVTSHNPHSPSVLFFRVVASGNVIHETRSFRPPDRSKQSSFRTLHGSSFAIPFTTRDSVCLMELWLKEIRNGRLTKLAECNVALDDDNSNFWIPFRLPLSKSPPSLVLTRQLSEVSQVIAAVKATRETRSHWVTGAVLTFLRLHISNADAGTNELTRIVADVEVRCKDRSVVISQLIEVVYPYGVIDSPSTTVGTLLQPLTLPPDTKAVSSIQVFHELLSGERIPIGRAPPSLHSGLSSSDLLPWKMSTVTTKTIPLLQGDAVPTRYSLVVTNALGATGEVNASSHIGLGVTLSVDRVEWYNFDGDSAAVQITLGSSKKAMRRCVVQLRRGSTGQTLTPTGSDVIDERFSKKMFARGTMTCELIHNSAIIGSATVRSDVFQNASGIAALVVRAGHDAVGTVHLRYALRLHSSRPDHKKRDIQPSQPSQFRSAALSSPAPLVLQLVSLSVGTIAEPCDVVVHMQRATNDETLCVARFQIHHPSSLPIQADEAVDGLLSTYGKFELGVDHVSAEKGEVRLSLWKSRAKDNELVFCGCAIARRDAIEQSMAATSRGAAGVFSVAILEGGKTEGMLKLRAFDNVMFDTRVLRRMCVLVKCISASGLSHGQRIVLEFKDEGGTMKQERIFLEDTPMASVGPFSNVRDAIIHVSIENPPRSSPAAASNVRTPPSYSIDIAQRLATSQTESQLLPVLHVSCTLLANGDDANASSVALSLQLFISCGDEFLAALSHRHAEKQSQRHSLPHASSPSRGHRSSTPLHEQSTGTPTRSLALPPEETSDIHVLDIPAVGGTRPAERIVLWKDLAVAVGGRVVHLSEGQQLNMFDAGAQHWKSYSQPFVSEGGAHSKLKGQRRDDMRAPMIAHDGCAVVQCGDGLLVDGGFGRGGIDPSLSQFTGRYESVRSIYQIASANMKSSIMPTDVDVEDGYVDQTSVCSLKDARSHSGWRLMRTRGNGKSPRSDHTLIRVDESLILAFGGFTLHILERVETRGNDEPVENAADDDAEQLLERASYMHSILTVGGDSTQLKGFNARRQAGHGIVGHESDDVVQRRRRRSKQCRTYEAQESLCNDLRCLNLDTFEWNILQPTMPGDAMSAVDRHGSISMGLYTSFPSDGPTLPTQLFERIALPHPTAGHVAEYVADLRSMFVFGGLQQSSNSHSLVASNELLILKVDSLEWFRRKDEAAPTTASWPAARYGHSSTQLANHDILIFGGATTTALTATTGGALPPHELLWLLRLTDLQSASVFECILLPTTVPITSRFRSAVCFQPDEQPDEEENASMHRGTLVIGSGILPTGMISDTTPSSNDLSSIRRLESLRHRAMVDDIKGVPTRPLVLRVSIHKQPVS
jgi:hypothetical protein